MRKIYLTLAFAALAAAAYAQNLNPQVQVTNVYESQAPNVRKQDIPVSVPDSVMHFDYVFDYSVFDSPYKGAYEFTPYAVRLVPDKTASDAKKLYLKAGIGYNPYPVLDAVWSPEIAKKGLELSVRQNLGGYWGNFFLPADDLGVLRNKYVGRDLEEQLAVEGRLSNARNIFTFGADYDGIFTSDYLQNVNYHSAGIKARLKSNTIHTGSFVYDVNFSGRFGVDNVSHEFGPLTAVETDFDLFGSLGTMLNTVDRLLVDYDIRYDKMHGILTGSINNVTMVPRVILKYDRFDLDLGVRMDYITKVALHPQVRIDYSLVKDVLGVYAGVKGAQNMVTYSYLKHFDHYFNPAYNEDFQRAVDEKLNVYLGFKGYLGPHFNYSVEGGRAIYNGAPFETIRRDANYVLHPGIDFVNYKVWFADVNIAWKSPRLEADAFLKVRKTSLGADAPVVNLPVLSADLRAVYNWRERTYLGVSCEMMTERTCAIISGVSGSLPFIADLSAFAQYKFNSRWGVWVKGGNLLNQFVRRTPLHIEEGINFTAGICLNL